jgi:hypothetical protein
MTGLKDGAANAQYQIKKMPPPDCVRVIQKAHRTLVTGIPDVPALRTAGSVLHFHDRDNLPAAPWELQVLREPRPTHRSVTTQTHAPQEFCWTNSGP